MTYEELKELLDSAETENKRGDFFESEKLCKEVLYDIEEINNSQSLQNFEGYKLKIVQRSRALRLQSESLWRRGKIKEALPLAQESASLAVGANEEANSWNNLGVVFWKLSDFSMALDCCTRALATFESLNDKYGIASANGNLGSIYYYLTDYQRTLEYMSRALQIFEELDDLPGIARNTGNIAVVYGNISDYTRAFEYYNRSLSAFRNIGDRVGEANTILNIGTLYRSLSDYSHALEYFSQALADFEELGDKSGLALVNGNLAIIYQDLAEYHRALEYYSKALQIHEEIGEKFHVARTIGHIGNVHLSLKDYPRALDYYTKALHKHDELGDKAGLTNMLGNIGTLYHANADFCRSMEYFSKALAEFKEIDMKAEMALMIYNIGMTYSENSFDGYSFDKAEEYLLQAISINETLGNRRNLYENHRSISDLYRNAKNWKKTDYHFRKYYEIEKEVLSEEAKKQAQRFAIEREVAVMQREQEILRIKNTELAEINAKLASSNSQLHKLNIEKNEFLGIAAHDLKNPLNAITMLSTILFYEADTLKIDQIQEYSNDIRTSSKQMFDLIINLLDVNKIEQGTMLPDVELFSAGDCIHSVVERYVLQSHNKNIQLVEEIEDAQVRTSKATLMQVLDNLLSNAIKFSPFDKSIFIRAEVNDQFVRISVQDEGQGLTDDDKQKLFGQFTRLSAQPTGGEHSSGLGLSIVKRLVEMMKGKIWCESEVGKGAKFIVELPKAE